MSKIVSEDTIYEVDIRVRSVKKTVVNPNGRGYEDDNVTVKEATPVLDTTTRASDLDKLRSKVQTILETLDGTE